METRLIPEEKVIQNYFFDGELDLDQHWSDEELATSKHGLSMVASADLAVFKRTEGLWDQRILRFGHPCVNPAYRVAGQPRNWELTRRVGDRYAKTLIQFDKVCFPDTNKVAAPSVDAARLVELQRTDSALFTQLAKSLLVLDLPGRFMAQNGIS